jgi:hypothetical protein
MAFTTMNMTGPLAKMERVWENSVLQRRMRGLAMPPDLTPLPDSANLSCASGGRNGVVRPRVA